MGLRTKVTVAVFALGTIGFLLGGLSATHSTRALLAEEMEARGHALLTAMTPPCAVALANGDHEALDRYLLQVGRADRADELELGYVMVLDHAVHVVSHSRPERFGEQRRDDFYREAVRSDTPRQRYVQATDGGQWLEVSAPIVNGLRWGTLFADFSLARVSAAAAQAGWRAMVTAAVLAVAWTVGLFLLLTFLVLRRTSRLAAAVQAFGQGKLGTRVEERGSDELARLARGFNSMAGALQSQTVNLEAKVKERSRALAEEKTKLQKANDDLHRAVEQLERLALTDGLTGLANHRRFQEALSFELARCTRRARPLSLIMIDVDHFKIYNDRHGHPAGDAVLRQLAVIFERNLRKVDVVARYGGEEFAILLLDTELAGAEVVAEKTRRAVQDEPFGGRTSPAGDALTISLGVASHPAHGATPTELIAAADAALYAAKAAGRNRVYVAPGPEADRPASGPGERAGRRAEKPASERKDEPAPPVRPLVLRTQEIPRGT